MPEGFISFSRRHHKYGKIVSCICRHSRFVCRDYPESHQAEIYPCGNIAGRGSGRNIQHRKTASLYSLLAGFEREDKEKILRAFPGADYMVCSLECTPEQKARVEEQLREAMENRFQYHYAVIGLPFILLKKPFYQKRHYTCSSYIARLLEESGICSWDKHFSLVTPKDFYQYREKEVLFEGSLREFVQTRQNGATAEGCRFICCED